MKKIGVLGAGTWGISLSSLLIENGQNVSVWDIDGSLLDFIDKKHTHPRFDYLDLKKLKTYRKLEEIVSDNEILVLVIPSQAYRATFEKLKDTSLKGKTFVICSKGIEFSTTKILSEVIRDSVEEQNFDIAVLSGPSHAEEVSKKLPTTVTIASEKEELAEELQKYFFGETFRSYTSSDLIGVQVGGSIKNVIAIAGGIADGMGLGDNTRAALITRGLAELTRLGKKMGARELTFMGLAGIGDLVVTVTSHHSRNRGFGELIGKGKNVQTSLDEVGMVVEGYYSAKSAHKLSRELSIEMPISEAVYRILYESSSPEKELKNLLNRTAKPEIY